MPGRHETAADLTARAMRDNPLNIAALGADAEHRAERMRKMFSIALPMTIRKGVVLGAFEGTTQSRSRAVCRPPDVNRGRRRS
ncbi:MAG: hypothetical protein ACLQU2_09800 [Candidatus Binataceae bacterium]